MQRVKRFPFQQFVSEAAVVAADVIRHTPVDARLARTRLADQLGRTRAGARRPQLLSSVDRRAARDRYPQALTPAERQVTGHNKAVRRPDSERLRADAGKTSLQRGKQAFREPVLGPARREHAAHESLSIRPMLAEVPLAGLSS